MKIAFLGNVNNFPFMLALGLRELGQAVTFLIDSDRQLDRPEFKYSFVSTPYPDWIIDVGPLSISLAPKMCLRLWRAYRILRNADLVVLNAFGIRFGAFIRNPTICVLTGTDIDLYANPQFPYTPVHNPGIVRRALGFLRHCINIYLMRAGIRGARFVWTARKGMLPGTDARLAELGIGDDRRWSGFLAHVESEEYRTPPSRDPVVRIFNAARFVWHQPLPAGTAEWENKRNDILLKGLALLLQKHPDRALEIVFVKKGVELQHTYDLLNSLGISGRITWLDELSQREFYDQVKNADIVTDQFGDHLVSMAGYEAMLLGRPVVANARLDEIEQAYGYRPPVVQAANAEEVCEKLAFLIENHEERARIGRQSRQFALDNLSPSVHAATLLERLRSMMNPQKASAYS